MKIIKICWKDHKLYQKKKIKTNQNKKYIIFKYKRKKINLIIKALNNLQKVINNFKTNRNQINYQKNQNHHQKNPEEQKVWIWEGIYINLEIQKPLEKQTKSFLVLILHHQKFKNNKNNNLTLIKKIKRKSKTKNLNKFILLRKSSHLLLQKSNILVV